MTLLTRPSLIKHLPIVWLAVGTIFELSAIGWSSTISAQTIVPDQTLSQSSRVTLQGAEWEVTGGTTHGSNLFHSFEQFSIPTGNNVYFNQDTVIENIFTRVTGTLESEINGLIRANGTSNLFLLNPNGILFGPNAQLDIGGSFVTTTAEQFNFGNGLTFGVDRQDAPPLLTLNQPIGLQFGSRVRTIEVQGSELVGATDAGLVFLGGDVLFRNGILISPSGRVELGGVGIGQQMSLDLTTWDVNYAGVNQFGDIRLDQQSSIDVSGNGGGTVHLQGNRIEIIGSKIFSINEGITNSGDISLDAVTSIVLEGELDPSLPIDLLLNKNAVIFTDVASLGNGGNIDIRTPALSLSGTAHIHVLTNGGVSASSISAPTDTLDGLPPEILPRAAAQGTTGDLTIEVLDLWVNNERDGVEDLFLVSNPEVFDTLQTRDASLTYSGIFVSSYGPGSGGRLTIDADMIRLATAAIGSDTQGFQDNASARMKPMTINTRILEARGAGQIGTVTNGDGDAANLNITATESIDISGHIELRGFPFRTAILSDSDGGSGGTGGNLRITTPVLRVLDGARVGAGTRGNGNGGELTISTDVIEVGRSLIDDAIDPAFLEDFIFSQINVGVQPGGEGNGGEGIIRATNSIQLREGGRIIAQSAGSGNAGNLVVTTPHLSVVGADHLGNPSTLSSAVLNAETDANAGGIVVQADRIQLRNQGQISVSHAGGGRAGNIELHAHQLLLDDGGLTTADNFSGNGGNIRIDARELITLTDASRITTNASTDVTGGNIKIRTDVLYVDDTSLIAAEAQRGNGGRVEITTEGLFLGKNPGDRITAVSRQGGPELSGEEELNGAEVNPLQEVAKLPNTLVDPSSALTAGCDPSDRFASVGRGGIPLGPSAPLLPEVNWATVESTLNASKQVIAEASHWHTDPESGMVQLAVDEHTPGAIAPIKTLINTGITLRKQGQYGRSLTPLHHALQALIDDPEPSLQAIALLETGISTWLAGASEDAIALLNQSLAIAQSQGLDLLLSDIYVSLGHIAQSQTQYAIAHEYYQQAADIAPDDLALIRALMGQLDGVITHHSQTPNPTHAQHLATTIPPLLHRLAPSSTSVEAQLHFASTLLQAQQQGIPLTQPTAIQDVFQVIIQQAEALGKAQALTYGLGYLGHLYEQQGQWEAAQTLTEKALFVAQDMTAPELSYQWHWQLGRILNAQWRESRRQSPQFKIAALSAYDNAIQSLQTLRSDLIAVNTDVQFDFRDQVEPVYREYTTLLVEPDASNSVPQDQLIKARQVIEALQLAEVDNFLGNSCLVAQPKAIDEIDTQAAVVYPIILGDRITTIVAAPGQPLQHHTAWVEEAELTRTVFNTVKRLSPVYAPTDHLSSAQTLYDWLVRPAVESGILSKTDTLTFVLDGPLRSLPMAVLHDGDRYLIENYSLALSSGLQLLAPKPLEQVQLSGVVAGLSQSRGGFTPLPGVEQELANITQYIDTALLANEDFTKANITESVTQQSPNILHLATHGQFGSSFDDTFLLTWDGRLNANELNALLQKAEGDHSSPLEMLILSACQTAAGDSRAVLGLAGLALRSGARSTLATLWNVNDQSTAIFMDEFYRQLQQPGITKAEAIRNAQLALMATAQYSEPFYWAPFLLIGNWL